MSFNLSLVKLEYWLKQAEYNIPQIKMSGEELKDLNYMEMEKNNRILGRSFHHTFEKWFRKWGRIPTPQEFIAMQMQDVRKNFSNEGWKRNHKIKFELTPTVEKGIKQRLLRSYISFINELHTELIIQEEFPSLVIERSDELDFAGIDLLVIDKKNGVEHKIHITKNSEIAIDYLFKKEGKFIEFRGYDTKLWAVPKWKKVNHGVYKDRDFRGHTFLLYGARNNAETKVVNGYPLFRKEYVINKILVNTELRKVA